MFRWSERGGYDWQLIDRAEDATEVVLGATLAYGMLDEPVADYGTLQLVGGQIRAELGRPTELAGGGVSVPEGMVEISQDTLTFAVRGRPDVAVSTWRRLAGYFQGTVPADLADPHPVDTFGWTRDAAFRSGMNSFTVSLLDLPPIVVAAEKVDRLRRHLDPSAGRVRSAFFTTDESLVGVEAFAAPPDDPRQQSIPAPGRARGAATPGSLGAPLGPVQFTAVVPRTRTGLAAGLALRTHFAEALTSVGGTDPGTGCVIHEFGADRWITVACEGVPAPQHRDRAIARTLAAPIADARLTAVILEVEQLSESQWARNRRVLGLPEDDEALTVPGVRNALGAALNTVHITSLLGPDDRSVSVLPGYPELMPELPEERGQKFSSWLAHSALSGGPSTVRLGDRTLLTDVPAETLGEPAERNVIDLDAVAVIIEHSPTNLAIFDASGRGVDVDTGQLRRGGKLKELLDRRLAGVPRIRLTEQPEQSEPTPEQRRTTSTKRRYVIGAIIAAVAFSAVISIGIVQSATRARPVTARVAEGQTVELASGTALTASGIETRADGQDLIVSTSVRICAGGDLNAARGTDPAVQRAVGPANFALHSQDGMAGERTDGGGPQLVATTLPEGECADGDLTYRIRDTGSPLAFSYSNPFGDDVVWYDQ
ncbi:hypothetical protein [Microlunatus speluncae]|uniref:hypothetical protein n=1 Tax=Microlunatus speluncae TaxID=2594267 RepID=UPI001266756F|nr:hypothetical protein [Microlunatus speluncae]